MTGKFGEKLGKQFDAYRTEIFIVISTLTLNPGSNLVSIETTVAGNLTIGNGLFIVGAVFLVLSLISSITDKREANRIQAESLSLRGLLSQTHINFASSWDEFAKEAHGSLGLGDTERISFYRHDKESDEFFLLGRYSINPMLNRRGRVTYPANQGCIGAAWQKGEAYEGNLPNPQANMVKYFEVNESRWQLPQSVCVGLAMKPQAIWAYALSRNGHRHAIVVIESEKKRTISPEELKRAFEQGLTERTLELQERLSPIEPSISFARKHGY